MPKRIVICEGMQWDYFMDDLHFYNENGIATGIDFYGADLDDEMEKLKGKKIRVVIEEVE